MQQGKPAVRGERLDEEDTVKRRYLDAAALALGGFVLLGVMMAFVMPPFQTPDENSHWGAALTRLREDWQPEGAACTLEPSLPLFFAFNQINFHPEQRVRTGNFGRLQELQPSCEEHRIAYGSDLTYPAVAAAALIVPQNATVPRQAVLMMYLARLLAGLMIAAALARLVFVAHRMAGVSTGILSILGVSLSPLFMQQAFSITSDTMILVFTIALATCLIGWGRLTWVDWVMYAVSGIGVATTKPVVLPAAVGVILYGMLREEGFAAFRVRGRRWLRLTPEAAVVVLVPLLFELGAYSTFGVVSQNVQPSDGRYVSAAAQMQFVWQHPYLALRAQVLALYQFMQPDSLAQPLGWRDTKLSPPTYLFWCWIAATLICIDLLLSIRLGLAALRRPDPGRRILARSIGGLAGTTAILGSALAITFSLYLAYTSVGSLEVQGLQGRYFFPIVLLMLVLLQDFLSLRRTDIDVSPAHERTIGLATCAVIAAVAVLFSCYGAGIFIDIAARYY